MKQGEKERLVKWQGEREKLGRIDLDTTRTQTCTWGMSYPHAMNKI